MGQTTVLLQGSNFWLRQEPKKSQCVSVRLSVPLVTSCLEQSIFIILAQIFKQSVRNNSAVSKHSESNQRAIREQSETTQRAIREQSESTKRAISEHQNKSQYRRRWSLKYCVLLNKMFQSRPFLTFIFT